jgi:hypothetical protein
MFAFGGRPDITSASQQCPQLTDAVEKVGISVGKVPWSDLSGLGPNRRLPLGRRDRHPL